MTKKTTIKMVAIDKGGKAYSVGKVLITEKQNSETGKIERDAYVMSNFGDADFHEARQDSGELHWKSSKLEIKQFIWKGQPMEDLKGIELVSHKGFGLGSLPESFKEYKLRKYDAVFCLDLREYENKSFNMYVLILTEEGLPALLTMSKPLTNRQFFVFPDCSPMVAIIIGNVREQNTNK
jgi:hypothetical protein